MNPYLTSLLNAASKDRYDSTGFVQPSQLDDFAEPATAEMVGSEGLAGKEARIAQIKQRLAEIAEEKKKYNLEEEMGKYKFLYDNDASTLMGYKQNLRNAEATEKIRKATEDATKASNAQTAWKQNAIDLEATKYDLASAKDAYNSAKASGDENGMRKAVLDIQRAQAKLNRMNTEQTQLRNKFAKQLGLTDNAESKALNDVSNVQTGIDLEGDISRMNNIKTLKGESTRLGRDYENPGYAIPKSERNAKYQKGVEEVSKFENDVKNSDLDEDTKQDLLSGLDELKRKVEKWKPGSKAPGRPPVVKTKEDYEKALNGLNPTQIFNKGVKYLGAAKKSGIKTVKDDKGVEHNIDDLIKGADSQGKK